MKISIRNVLCIVVAALFPSCARNTCKIDPPPTVIGTDKEIAAKAAASALGSAISNAEAGGSYRNIVNKTYVAVDKDDVAFYLLMQAYNCESERGNAAAAAEILKTARQELARRNRATVAAVASHPDTLTPTEQKVLKKSPLKREIAKTIAAPKPKAPRKPKATAAAPKAKNSPAPKASPTP